MTPKYPMWNVRKLDKRLRQLGCELIRKTGSHRHYSNPFHPDQLITFPEYPGDVPKGIVYDIVSDLGLTKDQFFDLNFKLKQKD